jgi:hypothetical protein
MANIIVRRVWTDDELLSLGSRWNTLHSRSYANDVTLSWEWVSTWWRVFGDGRSLSLLTAWEADDLVEIAPFAIRNTTYRGILPDRSLSVS